MARTIANGSGSGHPQPLDCATTLHTKKLDESMLDALRKALRDTGYSTYDSIAADMGGKDLSLVRKVLLGEKPMPEGFFDALPSQARGLYHARQAEAHGRRVFQQLDAETAVQQFAAGLLSLVMHGALSALLPSKSGGQLKVEAGNGQKKAVS